VKALRLATRGSALALAQSKGVAAALRSLHPGLAVELSVLKSEGDQQADQPLSAGGGQGLFTRVLEQALLRGEADLAVHSLKDLPTAKTQGLALAAISAREDWRDAWLSQAYASPMDLPGSAEVGTGSPRRRAQLALLRPGLRFSELRGNVDTRLNKVASGAVAGAVLALAGLKRLGLESAVRRIFGEDEMLPAPGQGFLALQTLAQGPAFDLCRAYNQAQAEAEALCERAFLARMQSGCLAPVGALARIAQGRLTLKVFVGLDPAHPRRLQAEGDPGRPEETAWALADQALQGKG
jgi:hydroxymethylbilane synthase